MLFVLEHHYYGAWQFASVHDSLQNVANALAGISVIDLGKWRVVEVTLNARPYSFEKVIPAPSLKVPTVEAR